MSERLKGLIQQAADRAEQDQVPLDGEPGGAVHRWCEENCEVPSGQMFFVVFLLTAELADRRARREGFRDQCDRAVQLARKALAKGKRGHEALM